MDGVDSLVDFGTTKTGENMMRGGCRRGYIAPGVDANVWCRSGRWGCRRTRISECWAVLTAECVYTEAIRANAAETRPGASHLGRSWA